MVTARNFSKEIKERGQELYDKNKVGVLVNINNIVYAKIGDYTTYIGSSVNNCTCPCDTKCKHMYALLLKIKKLGTPEELSSILGSTNNNNLIKIIKEMVESDPGNFSIVKKNINNNISLSNFS